MPLLGVLLTLGPARALAQTRCDDPAEVYEAGRRVGRLCPDTVRDHGLTTVDLSDRWAPRTFDAPGHPWREAWVALADERLEAVPEGVPRERDLELYGIPPTFRVLLRRLAQRERHACHAAVQDDALARFDRTLTAWTATVDAQRERRRTYQYLLRALARVLERHQVSSVDELPADDARVRSLQRQLDRVAPVLEAVRAAQEHLVCEGMLGERHEPMVFDWATAQALRTFQRRRAIAGAGHLDPTTAAALALDSREADFRAVLRALRERVVDASGVIEDGSARHERGTVLGRTLDDPELSSDAGQAPLPNGAPDLVSPATEAAARSLGWTSPARFVRFVEDHDGVLGPVVVRLPHPPRYHAAHVDVRVEIDRGGVWYQYPYTATGRRRAQPVSRRPVLTLFARDGANEVALVRWPTTIGGWQAERLPDGSVGLAYKGSPVGPRIWRDLVSAPAWLPPDTTPDEELVRRSGGGWVPKQELLGPGHRSAYGLVMLMHHREAGVVEDDGQPVLRDEGVRTHGSVSYRSILRGQSHGCHRLFNHLAVRLGSFLLAHREHVVRGPLEARYTRRVQHHGSAGLLELRTRGYRFELTPPVRVEVLEGRIRGGVRRPPAGIRPVREELIRRIEEESSDEAP